MIKHNKDFSNIWDSYVLREQTDASRYKVRSVDTTGRPSGDQYKVKSVSNRIPRTTPIPVQQYDSDFSPISQSPIDTANIGQKTETPLPQITAVPALERETPQSITYIDPETGQEFEIPVSDESEITFGPSRAEQERYGFAKRPDEPPTDGPTPTTTNPPLADIPPGAPTNTEVGAPVPVQSTVSEPSYVERPISQSADLPPSEPALTSSSIDGTTGIDPNLPNTNVQAELPSLEIPPIPPLTLGTGTAATGGKTPTITNPSPNITPATQAGLPVYASSPETPPIPVADDTPLKSQQVEMNPNLQPPVAPELPPLPEDIPPELAQLPVTTEPPAKLETSPETDARFAPLDDSSLSHEEKVELAANIIRNSTGDDPATAKNFVSQKLASGGSIMDLLTTLGLGAAAYTAFKAAASNKKRREDEENV